jgi:hypothetical protein
MPVSTQLDVWLKGFPRIEAEERLAALEAEVATIRNALALADEIGGPNGTQPATSDGEMPPSRPARIRRILRDRSNEPTAVSSMKGEMIERGWLQPREERLFYSALSTMTKREHLLRLQDGQYMLSKKGLEMD